MQYSLNFQQFDKCFITTNFVYYTTEWHYHLMHVMCFSGLWESEMKHWNQRVNTKNTAANPGCPMGWWKETTQKATNINPAVPGVTQRFQWLKQYSIRSKGSEKPKLGLRAPCLLHIEIYSQQRVQDVQIINHSFGFEFMVLKYIMILHDQHQVTKQLYLKQW